MMSEEDIDRLNKKGPNDLEEMNKRKEEIILALKTEKEEMQKHIKHMQAKCHEAGKAILDLELQKKNLNKENARLVEENSNFLTMLKANEGK